MRTFTAVIERDQETGLFVGYVPGWPGAHSQGETLDELHANLREVVDMLLEDGKTASRRSTPSSSGPRRSKSRSRRGAYSAAAAPRGDRDSGIAGLR